MSGGAWRPSDFDSLEAPPSAGQAAAPPSRVSSHRDASSSFAVEETGPPVRGRAGGGGEEGTGGAAEEGHGQRRGAELGVCAVSSGGWEAWMEVTRGRGGEPVPMQVLELWEP